MKFLVLFIALVFATKQSTEYAEETFEKNACTPILVKIEEDEYVKMKTKSSAYEGVFYNDVKARWGAYRWSKNRKRTMNNGAYNDEETAAHASDTLARKLMANGEHNLNLNFPHDETEVYPEEKTTTSKYIGVTYSARAVWRAQRGGKNGKKMFYNGYYDNEDTAAHASDTLARKLMKNDGHNLKLNFPDDETEVHREKTNKTSRFIGVFYDERCSRWVTQRRSKNEKRMVFNGTYKIEEKAAHASDTLARKLMENGEQGHKLNFPDDFTEVNKLRQNKRKRLGDTEVSQRSTNFEK